MHPHGGGDGNRPQRSSRGIGPRTTSGKTHSVIGVSADTQAGTEDWTDGFGLTEPTQTKSPSPAPHSPASQREAALLRIAKEENAPRRRSTAAAVTTRRVPASSAPPPPPPVTRPMARESVVKPSPAPPSLQVEPSSRTAATTSTNPAASAAPSQSSRRHRKDHRGDGGSEHSSRVSSRRETNRDDGRSSASARKPRQEHQAGGGGHHHRSRRGPRSDSTRTLLQGHGREGGGAGSAKDGEAVPRWRRSREEKDTRSAVSSAVNVAGRMAKPWEDIVEAANDSPTDSEILPAPQPRALRTPSAASTPTVSAKSVVCVCTRRLFLLVAVFC